MNASQPQSRASTSTEPKLDFISLDKIWVSRQEKALGPFILIWAGIELRYEQRVDRNQPERELVEAEAAKQAARRVFGMMYQAVDDEICEAINEVFHLSVTVPDGESMIRLNRLHDRLRELHRKLNP